MKVNILLVEDDPTMGSLLKTLLEFEGFSVVSITGNNEEEILSSLKHEYPELMLLDVHLKSINGINILTKIRESNSYNDLRIIMTSGMDLADECINMGADDFLLKPYLPDNLIQAINRLVGKELNEDIHSNSI
jgi:DNA-binding response OmpR family regulator